MFISRLKLRPGRALTGLRNGVQEGAYSDHQLVWSFFNGLSTERDFVFRLDRLNQSKQVIVVSKEQPRFSEKDWIFDTRPYALSLTESDKLNFQLRFNPSISVSSGKGRGQRISLVRYLKERDSMSHAEAIDAAAHEWIMRRADTMGIRMISEPLVEGYQVEKFVKGSSGHVATYPVMDVSGALEVVDVEKFTNVLYRGVGSAKGFGCGLMLVRRCS